MSLSQRELWTVVHGMLLGAVFLLAFAGGLAELLSLRSDYETPRGMLKSQRRLVSGTWIMALIAWLTVITGTYIVYPWYRAKVPAGAESLLEYPRSYLLTDPNRAAWHTFGMEWKEHVSWIAPILATAVAFVASRYRQRLGEDKLLRRALMVLFTIAFVCAGVGGVFGAFINKVAPIR
ncbi:MAG TPA: hypothetical protein VHP11_07800 [Tepidisphaeraceae bacterium]|nr:hypothetical protein [Tepidisphaeraceae bacterium]